MLSKLLNEMITAFEQHWGYLPRKIIISPIIKKIIERECKEESEITRYAGIPIKEYALEAFIRLEQ
jgi:hypothetical protein